MAARGDPRSSSGGGQLLVSGGDVGFPAAGHASSASAAFSQSVITDGGGPVTVGESAIILTTINGVPTYTFVPTAPNPIQQPTPAPTSSPSSLNPSSSASTGSTSPSVFTIYSTMTPTATPGADTSGGSNGSSSTIQGPLLAAIIVPIVIVLALIPIIYIACLHYRNKRRRHRRLSSPDFGNTGAMMRTPVTSRLLRPSPPNSTNVLPVPIKDSERIKSGQLDVYEVGPLSQSASSGETAVGSTAAASSLHGDPQVLNSPNSSRLSPPLANRTWEQQQQLRQSGRPSSELERSPSPMLPSPPISMVRPPSEAWPLPRGASATTDPAPPYDANATHTLYHPNPAGNGPAATAAAASASAATGEGLVDSQQDRAAHSGMPNQMGTFHPNSSQRMIPAPLQPTRAPGMLAPRSQALAAGVSHPSANHPPGLLGVPASDDRPVSSTYSNSLPATHNNGTPVGSSNGQGTPTRLQFLHTAPETPYDRAQARYRESDLISEMSDGRSKRDTDALSTVSSITTGERDHYLARDALGGGSETQAEGAGLTGSNSTHGRRTKRRAGGNGNSSTTPDPVSVVSALSPDEEQRGSDAEWRLPRAL